MLFLVRGLPLLIFVSVWLDSLIPGLISAIPVCQIRVYISRGKILCTCTKFYKTNSEKFDSDSKLSLILLAIPLDF